ncbi:selenoprotein N-like isoform X2 [Penaeus japonicus]|uniref:selenoprotein N-like isoform X2 n=1 Tax=Penaeus japonicus TaxID=27405 RepID=UPI001C715C55|nr:selenoprotein N-like isoform X2 [Penaeus japonicus]
MTSLRKRKPVEADVDRGPHEEDHVTEDESREDKVDEGLNEGGNDHQGVARVPPFRKYLLYSLTFLLGFAVIWLWPFACQTSKHMNDATLLTLRTHFTPVDPKAFDSFIDREESRSSLHGILSWKTASVAWSWKHPSSFAPLLPAEGMDANPGYVWRLIPDTALGFMYRYGPRGAAAVLRGKTFDCLDIIFRLHAEYQLNTPPRRPLWFTPAAFLGRLVINMTDQTVQHFDMEVPIQQQLNLDLEWLIGPNEDEDMEVTITHLKQMRLSAEGSLDPESLAWSQEITHKQAHDLLQKELYRYKQVEYHNFTEAFIRSSRESRPIHTLLLWGVLEDQSC